MAIQEVKRKIHFQAFTSKKGRPEVDRSVVPTVTISKKYGTIHFSTSLIRETEMEGKFVKLFYEPTKKIVGWQLRKEVAHEEMKSWKLCTPKAANGTWVLGVKKLLDQFGGRLTKDSYQGLEVKKYKEMGTFENHSGQTFYFVELEDEVVD